MAWSDLPLDLLHCITSHLNVVDFFRFSIACTTWYSALANSAIIKIRCLPSPWLIIPSAAGEASHTLTFRDFTRKECGVFRHSRLSSPASHIFERRCIGSNNGWLVSLDSANLQPILLNPLTMVERSLPSLFTIPKDESDDSLVVIFWDKSCQKIVVSSNDPLGTAVVIYGRSEKLLALARPDEEAWVLVTHGYNIEDVCYREEDRMFYAIDTLSLVLSFDLNGENVKVIWPGEEEWRREGWAKYSYARYYITFCSGNLLRIERKIAIVRGDVAKTYDISVSKLVSPIADPSCSFSEWSPVDDLGGFSIFIGCNHTFSLQPMTCPGIKPNCIYFSEDWEHISSNECIRDAGLYDLRKEKFKYFRNSGRSNWSTSIWFSPSLT